MTTNVMVVGHADGDGHLITEQTRRNLAAIPGFSVDVLVDPKRTQGHQIWTRLDQVPEIEPAQIVFFVDLMFSPMGFVEQSQALVDYARFRPAKRFFVIDHHPLPNSRLSDAPNIRGIYRPDVFDCTFGPRSGMMVIAALCERQRDLVSGVVSSRHDELSMGVRRAAAPGGPLSGAPLLKILRNERWDILADLAAEDAASHRMVRGRRVANLPQSKAMAAAIAAANDPVQEDVNRLRHEDDDGKPGRAHVPYDIGMERFTREDTQPPSLKNAPVPAKDLETLMTLLEVAALSLTTSPDATFALEDLVAEAAIIGGEGIYIDIRDVQIVLSKFGFIERSAGAFRLC